MQYWFLLQKRHFMAEVFFQITNNNSGFSLLEMNNLRTFPRYKYSISFIAFIWENI